jgi:hypothetical protein
MLFKETELERLMLCPLMVPTGPSKMETCAQALTSWALRKSLEGSLKGTPSDILHIIRGKVLELHDTTDHVGTLARTTAFRMFNLLVDYEVLHLEQPYNLILAGYTIQGKYALLRKRKGACLPYVLVLHTEEPKLKHNHALPPSLDVLARWVHVTTTTKYSDARVLNYPVLRGRSWVNKGLDSALAKQYLESMLKVASLRPNFPRMGEHCESCATKPCLEVFNGQDDNSESERRT